MRSTKFRLFKWGVFTALVFAVSCAGPAKIPVFLAPGFDFSSIDTITILPPVDTRVDKQINVNLDKQLAQAAEKIIRKKGYRTSMSPVLGEVGTIVEEDLKDARPDWVKRLGPPEARWVMVVCLVDVATKLTLGSTGNAEIAGYLYDKETGLMVWKDKGIDQEGEAGLIAMAFKGLMDEAAIGGAVTNLLASIPKRK
jgi:hypothetical protein